MTATPLFDSIARRSERSVVPPIVPTGYATSPITAPVAGPVPPVAARRESVVGAQPIVPPALVAAIDAIPAAIGCPDADGAFDRNADRDAERTAERTADRAFDLADHTVPTVAVAGLDREVVSTLGDILIRRVVDSIEQELGRIDRRRAVVEALGDRITQLVVDTMADELDRIDRDLEIPGV